MNDTTHPFTNNPYPTVSSSYSLGWEVMKKHFLELLLVIIIMIAISIPVGIADIDSETVNAGEILLGLFALAFSFFIVTPVSYGMQWVFLKMVRGDKYDVSDLFEGFKSNYINIILANLLTGAIIGAGIIFFIIPGIIFACKFAFVPYLVMDKKLEVIEAVKTSWNMTKGHTLTIFLMALLVIPIFILGLLMIIIGILPAVIWIEAAFASLYHSVDIKLNDYAEADPVVE